MSPPKMVKKGKSFVDDWLDELGLYRKNVAYDETCLFRSVSEQLFNCQIYHERVRKECIQYAKDNFNKFSHLVESYQQWCERLSLLEKHMAVCGNIEIFIISYKYNKDVLVFDASKKELFNITQRNIPDPLLLCLMDEDHYDVVYKKEHIANAGFCQSVIYKLFYENIFGIESTSDIVKNMLYDKNFDEEILDGTSTKIAPFPFKVAKALDPSIYRNIEYDSWVEVRKEMRLGDWYYGDDKLILGTKCRLRDGQGELECYIQDITKEKDTCVVYITHLAEKRTVKYQQLLPESDAKPWPLPYRFSKSLSIGAAPKPPVFELKLKKRTKDKKRSSSVSECSFSAETNNSENKVNTLIGAALQMSPPAQQVNSNEQSSEASVEPEPETSSNLTLNISNDPPDQAQYQWSVPQWPQYYPPTPDSYAWPQTPVTPQSEVAFNYKPMVASAPVTPNLVTFHDPNYPYFYNCHVDPYGFNWPAPGYEYPKQQEVVETPIEDAPMNNPKVVNKAPETVSYIEPPPPPVCTNYPNPPPMDMYSPVVQLAPLTPIIYAPPTTELMIPTTPIPVYTPPVDMQYLSPAPYVCPPTPPTANWYTRITPQGFVFPTPNQTNPPRL